MAKFYRTEDRTVLLELFGAGSSVENLKNLKANKTDAAIEKHVQVVTQDYRCCFLRSTSNASRRLYYWRIYRNKERWTAP